MSDTSINIGFVIDELAGRLADQVAQRLKEEIPRHRFEDQPQDGPATAEWLRIDPQTLDRLRKQGKVPFIQAGRRILYRPRDVAAALTRRTEGGSK